jgi:hypothetical protein
MCVGFVFNRLAKWTETWYEASMEDRYKFEDTKGVIRIRISKKNRQHNGQKKTYKRTNNDLQNTHTQNQRSSNTKNAKNRSYLEQELPTLPEHLSSHPVFSVFSVTRSLVLCVCVL